MYVNFDNDPLCLLYNNCNSEPDSEKCAGVIYVRVLYTLI